MSLRASQAASVERRPRPASSKEIARIRSDALSAIAKSIPDPEHFAWTLKAPWCFWLAAAYRSQDPANAGCYRVRQEHVADLRLMGLVDRDGYLGAFGFAVYKAIVEQAG